MTSRIKAWKYTWPNGSDRAIIERYWDVQRPPFHAPLPYKFQKIEVTSAGKWSNPLFPDDTFYPPPRLFALPSLDNCNNRSYDSISSKMGDTASWGINLAEAKQSVGMVVSRATQLLKFTNAVRKFQFGTAANILGVRTPTGLKKTAKAFSDNWLEYHFGWSPLISDVHNSVSAMTNVDFGTRKIQGSARGGSSLFQRDGSNNAYTLSWRMSSRQCATAQITNESSYLANQMGLLNPLSVAWDAVPFSFVVDWFTNVGQVLGSVTGFVGVTLSDSYTTTCIEGEIHKTFQDGTGYYLFENHKNLIIERGPNLTGPKLAVKPFQGFSPSRGATAISLLLQKMR
jgi:hypothetical protein